NSTGTGITVTNFISSTSNSVINAKILNNTITVPATSFGDGIMALFSGIGADAHVKIDGNKVTVNHTNTADGIRVGTPDAGSSPDSTAIVTNNTVTMNNNPANSGQNGIHLQSTKGGTAVFKVEGNTVSNATIDGIFLFRPNSSTSTVSLERGIDPL